MDGSEPASVRSTWGFVMRRVVSVIVLALAANALAAPVLVDVDPATEHQTIDGFGANQPQYYYVTDYFDGVMLDLAFRRSGMGISLLRCDMPLGFEGVEGTSDGNDNSDSDVIDWDGFDTSVLDGLAAVAQGASARGCEQFVATPWSPPYWMKTNGSETGGGSLLAGMEPELAEYFRAFLTYLSGGTGEVDPPVLFDHVTIQNEPSETPSWWGCYYSPSALTNAMRYVGGMLEQYFPSVTMAAGDNSTTAKAWSQYLPTIMTDPDVEPMVGILSVHPYDLPWNNPDSQSAVIHRWDDYRTNTGSYGRRSWQLEHCDADYPANPNRLTWTSGLNGAGHLHRALVDGRVNAWSFWTLYRRNADNEGYGHSLWYSESTDGDATLKASPKVSTLTPFYRYVRPGYRRVAATPSDASTDLRVTGFKAPGGVDDGLVVVVINRGGNPVDLNASISDPGSIVTLQRCEATEYSVARATPHGVHGGQPVTLSGGLFSATVPPKSVTAFVHEAGSPWPTAAFDAEVAGLSFSVDASASTPSTLERYEWDFGDGTAADGVTAVHDYTDTGTYDVILTVTEAQGGVHTLSSPVSILGANLSGNIVYYRTAAGDEPGHAPVGDVTVDLDGETFIDSTTSDPATGDYAFEEVPVEDVSATPSRQGGFNGVSSYDAALISQFRVGMVTLTDHQQIAAEVSGNGSISSYDAALVSQFRVGMIDRFPIAETSGSDWAFSPPARSYQPLDSNRDDEDYVAILYGDVSGNWTASARGARAGAPGTPSARHAARPVEPNGTTGCVLSLRRFPTLASVDDAVRWTLKVEGCQGLLGLDLDLAYDPRRLTIAGVATKDSGALFDLASDGRDGILRLALYAATPLLEDGDILLIEARGAAKEAGQAALGILSAEANEGRIPVSLRTPSLMEPTPIP